MQLTMSIIAGLSMVAILLAIRMLAAARSPPAAYAAAFLGVAAVGALCLSLLIIWLIAG
jgi:hypothetical protein